MSPGVTQRACRRCKAPSDESTCAACKERNRIDVAAHRARLRASIAATPLSPCNRCGARCIAKRGQRWCQACRFVVRREQLAGRVRRRPEPTYTPIEDILAAPIVRVLRTLRWFDWVATRDLFDLLEADTFSATQRDAYDQAICMACNRGHIERVGNRRNSYYRITLSGRRALQRKLESYDLTVSQEAA